MLIKKRGSPKQCNNWFKSHEVIGTTAYDSVKVVESKELEGGEYCSVSYFASITSPNTNPKFAKFINNSVYLSKNRLPNMHVEMLNSSESGAAMDFPKQCRHLAGNFHTNFIRP